MSKAANLFAPMPAAAADEHVEALVEAGPVRIERIVSFGQRTREGEWLAESRAEWVVVLEGSAGLLFEGEAAPRPLSRGDHVLIPAQMRHRVAWTDPAGPTVWLAVHYG